MKFYSDKNNNNYHLGKIRLRKLTSIYIDNIGILFYKNGVLHNSKNAAYIDDIGQKQFFLNNKACLLYTSPSPRDKRQYRMPSSA